MMTYWDFADNGLDKVEKMDPQQYNIKGLPANNTLWRSSDISIGPLFLG